MRLVAISTVLAEACKRGRSISYWNRRAGAGLFIDGSVIEIVASPGFREMCAVKDGRERMRLQGEGEIEDGVGSLCAASPRAQPAELVGGAQK